MNESRVRRLLLAFLMILMPITATLGLDGSRRESNLAASDILLPAAAVLTAWFAWRRKLRLPLAWLCALMLASVTLSLAMGVDRALTSRDESGIAVEILKLAYLWFHFFLIANLIREREDFLVAVRWWAIASVPEALAGIAGSLSYQITGIENPYALQFRAEGTLGDSNLFGAYLSVSFFLVLLYRTLGGSRWMLLAIPVQLAGIFFSASRGTMLTVAVSFAVLVVLTQPFKRLAAVGAGLAFAAVVGGIAVSNAADLLESNPFTERLATVTVSLNNDAAADRAELWHDAAVEWLESPLTGIGRGTFRLLSERTPTEVIYVHNTYLGILCETGLIGLIVYMAFFLRYPFALARGHAAPATKVLLIALLSFGLSGITISIENVRGVWILIGMLEAYGRVYAPAA